MLAARYDFPVEKGSTFELVLRRLVRSTRAPVDLTGCTARMKVRNGADNTQVVMDLTTGNSKIVIDGAAGKITVTESAAVTAAIAAATGFYDLELEFPGGKVEKIIKGRITFEGEATV